MKSHRWIPVLTALSLWLACIVSTTAFANDDGFSPGVDVQFGSLVSTEWLAKNLDAPDLVILDCTVLVTQGEDGSMQNHSGWENYKQGHIPGAGFADLTTDLSDKNAPLEFTLPSVEEFARTMGMLGVGDTSRVVLYDNLGSVWAAREIGRAHV